MYCRKWFSDDIAECMRYVSAQPNALVGVATTFEEVEDKCGCKSAGNETTNSACNMATEAACKCDWTLVNPSKSSRCIQKDIMGKDAGCPYYTSITECETNTACKWNKCKFQLEDSYVAIKGKPNKE
jgi:hypothetical protein